MSVKIFHNPRCSKSRQTLQLIQDQGITPEIIDYLNYPPDAAELENIIRLLNITPRDLMRKGETEYKALQLEDKTLSDADLITAMVQTPKLIERPIVVANGKAAIGRPPEDVLAIL